MTRPWSIAGRCLSVLRSAGAAVSMPAIAFELHEPHKDVDDALRTLLERGEISRTGEPGRYLYTGAMPALPPPVDRLASLTPSVGVRLPLLSVMLVMCGCVR
jgi:hypothetical protein